MQAQWLSRALESAKMSQAELARRLSQALNRSIDRAAVNKAVKGVRDLTADEMLATSRITGVPAPRGASRQVPLVGYVGASTDVNMFGEGDNPNDHVEGPDSSTEKTVAVEIRGDSLGALFDRWLVFYDDVRRPVTEDLIGQPCVVGLDDGRVLVKKVQRADRKGRFHLIGERGDPILNVKLLWAARVKHMAPRR
jgi:transcriptional regulator with XRE-family HTH domain